LLLVAGVVAVVGTFLPLYWEGSYNGDGRRQAVMSSWKLEFAYTTPEVDGEPWQSPQFGVPIVLAAVLLAVAAALVLLPESQRLAARYLGVAATGLLIGSVAATGSFVASAVGYEHFAGGLGEGTWMLAAAAVVAVAGVVLIHSRRAEPRPEGPAVYRVDDDADEDVDTPPFGIPVVEIAQIPESGHERTTDGEDRAK
jgi:hypothetical protein